MCTAHHLALEDMSVRTQEDSSNPNPSHRLSATRGEGSVFGSGLGQGLHSIHVSGADADAQFPNRVRSGMST